MVEDLECSHYMKRRGRMDTETSEGVHVVLSKLILLGSGCLVGGWVTGGQWVGGWWPVVGWWVVSASG